MKNDSEIIKRIRKKWEIKNRIQTIFVSLAIPSLLIGLNLLLKHDIVSELQVKYLGALWGFLLCGRGIFNIALQKWSKYWLEIECIILEKEIIEKGGFYKLFFH